MLAEEYGGGCVNNFDIEKVVKRTKVLSRETSRDGANEGGDGRMVVASDEYIINVDDK